MLRLQTSAEAGNPPHIQTTAKPAHSIVFLDTQNACIQFIEGQ